MNNRNTITKSIVRGIAAISLLACSHAGFAQAIPDYVQAAVASSERSPEMTARDVNRKPAELLVLSGVKPGDTVVEFGGFGQYFTTLLSSVVGASGKVMVYDLPYTERFAGEPSRAFDTAHDNSTYELVDYNTMTLPSGVDAVFNVLYYHDLPLNQIDTAALNKKIFDALKPGGVFFIVDHNAEAGSGTRDVEKLHRIDPAVIREEVQAAGFVLAEASDLLANPDDDHTQMVFTDGTRGHTDQSVFKFVKP
ncbi:MAG: class I SAM-dependent methyltransferase [Pseudohongiellaceae bacterium]|jgi:predicted methyltransferase